MLSDGAGSPESSRGREQKDKHVGEREAEKAGVSAQSAPAVQLPRQASFWQCLSASPQSRRETGPWRREEPAGKGGSRALPEEPPANRSLEENSTGHPGNLEPGRGPPSRKQAAGLCGFRSTLLGISEETSPHVPPSRASALVLGLKICPLKVTLSPTPPPQGNQGGPFGRGGLLQGQDSQFRPQPSPPPIIYGAQAVPTSIGTSHRVRMASLRGRYYQRAILQMRKLRIRKGM